MSTAEQKLNSLLAKARELPPFVSRKNSERFLVKHGSSTVRITLRERRIRKKLVFATGGIMSVITAIVLIVITFSDQTPIQPEIVNTPVIPSEIVSAPVIPPNPAVLVQDDSVKAGQKEAVVVTKSLQINTDSLERVKDILRRNATFASWTKERIEAYAVYELDSMELDRIGITVLADGSILSVLDTSSSHRLTETRKELPGGVIRYTLTFPPSKESDDGIQFADSEAVSDKVASDEQARQSAARKTVFSSVLSTNSKGRTYGYSHSINVSSDPAHARFDLIAIKVPQIDSTLPQFSDDYYYIYWFEPTPDFLKAMPERVRRAIDRTGQEGNPMPSALAETGNPDEANGLLASVYPNPVTESNLTVRYSLPASRRVAVSMYDLSGERIQNMSVTEEREKGTWEDHLSLGDIPNGVYLLAVTTDKGEQSVQPIILKR